MKCLASFRPFVSHTRRLLAWLKLIDDFGPGTPQRIYRCVCIFYASPLSRALNHWHFCRHDGTDLCVLTYLQSCFAPLFLFFVAGRDFCARCHCNLSTLHPSRQECTMADCVVYFMYFGLRYYCCNHDNFRRNFAAVSWLEP